MKSVIKIVLILLVLGCKQPKKETITIAVAANMQFAIEEIAKAFTEHTGVTCSIVIGSSGKLTAQIKEGAPYDIFISANLKYPEEIYKNNLAVYPPKVYGYGQLVLWSMYDQKNLSLSTLLGNGVKHIALANPKTAPYGEAAIEVLEKHKIYDSIKDKLVYGESIAQANQFIISKSTEIGFTAKSVVVSPKMKGKGYWITIDKNSYQPIDQSVIIIKQENQHIQKVQKFYDFLFAEEAKEILEDFGYLVTE